MTTWDQWLSIVHGEYLHTSDLIGYLVMSPMCFIVCANDSLILILPLLLPSVCVHTESGYSASVYYCEYRRLGNFHVKIICVKNFRVVKFSWFRSIREIFLTVDNCNMDKRLESSWRLVYYQVSGDPGIARCSCRSDIYLGECGLARKLIH